MIPTCSIPQTIYRAMADSGRRTQERWLSDLLAGQFRLLFEYLPGTLFFAKNADRRLMCGNSAFVRRCGLDSEEELIGLVDHDLFPPRLAEKYATDDRRVLATGQPLLGITELFPNVSGEPDWSVTDKLPIFDRRGKVAGICGTVRSYEGVRAALQPYLDLAPVSDFIKQHLCQKLHVTQLAEIAGLSVRQLERRFRETFQTSPRAYLVRMRVLAACEILESTNNRMTEVALAVGFYDHSDFSRHFKRVMGLSPTQYRSQQMTRLEPPSGNE